MVKLVEHPNSKIFLKNIPYCSGVQISKNVICFDLRQPMCRVFFRSDVTSVLVSFWSLQCTVSNKDIALKCRCVLLLFSFMICFSLFGKIGTAYFVSMFSQTFDFGSKFE